MSGRPDAPVTGLVLAAGSSRRLGEPKQLLPLDGGTLLGATLARVRTFGLDQLLVTLGGAEERVREQVDLDGFEQVEAPSFRAGCASSITSALDHVRDDAAGIVLLLGDQPRVTRDAVEALLGVARPEAIGTCTYDDGPGHPFWLGRGTFDDLATLHGDKAVWKVLESGRHPTISARVAGPVPLDVDTHADHDALVAQSSGRAVGAGAAGEEQT